jgi:hypothetical protein
MRPGRGAQIRARATFPLIIDGNVASVAVGGMEPSRGATGSATECPALTVDWSINKLRRDDFI